MGPELIINNKYIILILAPDLRLLLGLRTAMTKKSEGYVDILQSSAFYGTLGIWGRSLDLFHPLFLGFLCSQEAMSVNAKAHNWDEDEKESEAYAVTVDQRSD